MRLGPEFQSVGAEFSVTNVRTPILTVGKLVKHGYRFEAGPTGCKMSNGDRIVTLDVVKNSFWVHAKAYTKIEGAHSHQWWTGYLKSWVISCVLHQLTRCESDCVSYEPQCGAQKHTCGAVYFRETRLNADTWTKKHCWTDDDVTWKVQLTQPYQGP